MKSENFKKWEPINNIPSELFLDSITDDHNGLAIALRGEDSDDMIFIQFGLFVLSYQSTTETCILKNLDDHLVLKSAWPLFICDDSNYIDWLVKQSYKIIENEPKSHYVIKHADGIIDIVSTKAPDVKWQ
ncbi:hypothetical protein TH53_10335 [Pedobacter lusitanus]|uniref:Uncharacterized protein n=1 Tax=Pedobacter lusitanus TaxID=1503925 RepID=A0A0D0FXJ7_9SPHI|nr:hypothetical protein [Pedobacter lusitanus]KIO77239.1 hypothetical protein TH53_10335 [Pedobacter lusitanus]